MNGLRKKKPVILIILLVRFILAGFYALEKPPAPGGISSLE